MAASSTSNGFKRYLLSGAGFIIMSLGAGAAAAQETESPVLGAGQEAEGQLQEGEGAPTAVVSDIVVTGSRIARAGFTAPTPVTVVSAEQLVEAKPLISEALNDLPAIQVGSQRAGGAGSGGQGFATVSLRNLGAGRTLVLLDGRRFVPTAGNSTVDTSLMPNALMQRVDIVTGGASAAYGADAVAGVVNYVLDTRFEGNKISAEYGISERGDVPATQFSYAGGRSILGGRGHLLGSFEVYRSDGMRQLERDFFLDGSQNLLPNPCPEGAKVTATCTPDKIGGPRFFRTRNVRLVSGNPGGLITSGPLKGITFEDNGQTRMFQYGQYVGSRLQLGGEGDASPGGDGGPRTTAVGWLERANTFNRLSFEVNDRLTVFAENSLGWNYNSNVSGWPYALGATQLQIKRDNAYLPDSVGALMDQHGLQTISVGKQLAQWSGYNTRTRVLTWRPMIGFNYDITDKISAEVYYQYGYNRRSLTLPGNLDQIALFEAVDAVVVPATGAPAGLIPGTVVCRSTLTNPGNGCAPANIFGPNASSEAAIAYTTTRPGRTTWNLTHFEQQVLAASVSGEVIEGWAGPISAAAGIEIRSENMDYISDEYSQIPNPITRSFGGYRAGNSLPYSGEVDVKEYFAEAVVPLVRDLPFAQFAELNIAGRVTDYSTSGTVETWKVGLLYNPVEDFRIRATRSRDIRAPTMQNLFQAGNAGNGNFVDPFRGGIDTAGVRTVTLGNPELAPEVANTLVYGFVYQPSWVPGLSFSLDRYEIDIEDSIASIGNQTILDQCFLNPGSDVCAFIVRDANGVLTAINNRPFNFAFARTAGYDMELSLRRPIYDWMPLFGGGDYNLRLLGTKVDYNNTQVPGAAIDEAAGEIASPDLQALAQLTLSKGDWRLFIQAKHRGGVVYDNIYVEGVDIDDNTIGSVTYFDTRLSRNLSLFGTDSTVSVSVNNLFDRQPPLGVAGASGGDYDVVGRYLRFSISSRF